MAEDNLTVERAREFLAHSTSGVESELEQAGAWLRHTADESSPDFWRVDAMAGAIGDLANVWGHLVLWARSANDRESEADLDEGMKRLVAIRSRLVVGQTNAEMGAMLREEFERLSVLYQRLQPKG